MKNNEIPNPDYLDIIFEGRNKKYGGYELRRNYNRRVYKSLLIIAGVGVVTTAYSVTTWNTKADKKIVAFDKKNILTAVTTICAVKPPPPHAASQVKPHITHGTSFNPPKIEDDNKVHDPDLLRKQEKTGVPGRNDTAGNMDSVAAAATNGTGKGVDPVTEQPKPPTILKYVDEMPTTTYNLHEYLAKNTRYPDVARLTNIEGKVIVKFVVNDDGTVTDAEIARGIGGGCDEEAARVVLHMPKWTPGKQNGRCVKVYFNLPIVFKLE
jgi:protein TonB